MKKSIIILFSLALNAVIINPLTVVDNTTKLEWQDNYSENGDIVKRAIWIEAIEYCENLTLDEKNDWRLPNIKELGSIVNRNIDSPTIKSGFKKNKIDTYWSSSVYWFVPENSGNELSLSISFVNATEVSSTKTNIYSVRCVRDN